MENDEGIRNYALDSSLPSLPVLFGQAGYKTCGIMNVTLLRKEYELVMHKLMYQRSVNPNVVKLIAVHDQADALSDDREAHDGSCHGDGHAQPWQATCPAASG